MSRGSFAVCQQCDGTGNVLGGGATIQCSYCKGSGQVRIGEPVRKGRPPVYATDEERRAAKAASTAKSNAKVKNVTMDADLVGILSDLADELVDTFGFRPTISQTLRHLINKRTKV